MSVVQVDSAGIESGRGVFHNCTISVHKHGRLTIYVGRVVVGVRLGIGSLTVVKHLLS